MSDELHVLSYRAFGVVRLHLFITSPNVYLTRVTLAHWKGADREEAPIRCRDQSLNEV